MEKDRDRDRDKEEDLAMLDEDTDLDLYEEPRGVVKVETLNTKVSSKLVLSPQAKGSDDNIKSKPTPTLEEINQKNKFFMAMNQYAEHSYLTLGYMEDDQPIILSAFGKYADLDKMKRYKMISSTGNEAFLEQEKTYSYSDKTSVISYSAWDIDFSQYLETLELVTKINQDIIEEQFPLFELDGKIKGSDYANLEEQLTKYSEFKNTSSKDSIDNIKQSAEMLNYKNTCRTTAKMILETILGYTTKISSLFFIKPQHSLILFNRQPKVGQKFYVYPAPPQQHLVPRSELDDEGKLVYDSLQKIYDQLTDIPNKNPQTQITYDKFTALKAIYTDSIDKLRTSSPNMAADAVDPAVKTKKTNIKLQNGSVSTLLTAINQHYKGKSQQTDLNNAKQTNSTQEKLEARRGNNIISKVLGIKSSTSTMLDKITSDLEKNGEKYHKR